MIKEVRGKTVWGWNTKGNKTLDQVKAGAMAISKNYLMHVYHLFESSIVHTDKCCMKTLESANKIVKETHNKEVQSGILF